MMKILVIIAGFIICLWTTTLLASQAGIFTQPLPDTESYSCKFCPETEESHKSIELGVGFNTSKNAKYMEYNGHNGDHIIPLLNAEYISVNEDGRYTNVRLYDLGKTSREMNLYTGVYGRYEAVLNYDQISRYQLDNFAVPFSGVKTGNLGLVAGATQSFDVRQERSRFAVQAKKIITSQWETIADYRIENKQGLKPTGAAMGSSYITAQSVMLPEPIDQITQSIKLGLAFNSHKLQVEAGYQGSLFDNSLNQLRWENVFKDTVTEPAFGRMTLAPDNQHHELYGLAGYRVRDWLKFKGQLAVGQIRQDQAFTDYTVNTALNNSELPQDSLNGKVNTLTGNLRGNVKVSEKISGDVNFYIDRKDNKTSQAVYNYVTLDSVADASKTRSNLPYGYRKIGTDVTGNYWLSQDKRASAGYKFQRMSRTYSEVDKTKSNEYWARYFQQINPAFNLSLRYSFEERVASDYLHQTSPVPAQNPLLRKYNLADKNRNLLTTNLGYSGIENITLDVYLDYATDDYDKTKIGLTETFELAFGINLTARLSDTLDMNVFLSRENLQSVQAGSINQNASSWKAETEDLFTSVGLGLEKKQLRKNLDVGTNFIVANATGNIDSINLATGASQRLPALKTARYTFELYTTYHYDEDLKIKCAFQSENYDESDWHVDGMEYDSVPALLGVGNASYSYSVNYISASIAYQF